MISTKGNQVSVGSLTALHPASFRPYLAATSLLLVNDSGLTHVDLTQAALVMDPSNTKLMPGNAKLKKLTPCKQGVNSQWLY